MIKALCYLSLSTVTWGGGGDVTQPMSDSRPLRGGLSVSWGLFSKSAAAPSCGQS